MRDKPLLSGLLSFKECLFDSLLGSIEDIAISSMLENVKNRVICKYEILHTNSLLEIYCSKSSRQEIPDKRTLIKYVVEHFKTDICLWSPKHGESFFLQ